MSAKRMLGIDRLPRARPRAPIAPPQQIVLEGETVEIRPAPLPASRREWRPEPIPQPMPGGEEERSLFEGTEKYNISYVGLILLGIVIIFNVINIAIYSGDTQSGDAVAFVGQNNSALAFMGIGLIMFWVFNNGIKIGPIKGSLFVNVAMFVGVAIMIQALLIGGVGRRMAVTPTSYFLFFLSLAVAEELLFRAGLLVLFKRILLSVKVKPVVASAVSIPVVAILFAWAHTTVYTESIYLFDTFLMGCLFGLALELSIDKKRYLDVPMLTHFVVNVVAGVQFIMQTFGGF